MTDQQRLEAAVSKAIDGTSAILHEEVRALILRSAPMMAKVNGEQACHLLVQALDAWAKVPLAKRAQ